MNAKLAAVKDFALRNKAVIAITIVATATVALVVADLVQDDEPMILESLEN